MFSECTGSKCSGPDMKSDKYVRDFGQNFGREMQSGRRRGQRARCLREYRLVSFGVGRIALRVRCKAATASSHRVKIDIIFKTIIRSPSGQNFCQLAIATPSIFVVAPTRIFLPA